MELKKHKSKHKRNFGYGGRNSALWGIAKYICSRDILNISLSPSTAEADYRVVNAFMISFLNSIGIKDHAGRRHMNADLVQDNFNAFTKYCKENKNNKQPTP